MSPRSASPPAPRPRGCLQIDLRYRDSGAVSGHESKDAPPSPEGLNQRHTLRTGSRRERASAQGLPVPPVATGTRRTKTAHRTFQPAEYDFHNMASRSSVSPSGSTSAHFFPGRSHRHGCRAARELGPCRKESRRHRVCRSEGPRKPRTRPERGCLRVGHRPRPTPASRDGVLKPVEACRVLHQHALAERRGGEPV